MHGLFLGIDCGTQGSKALLLDAGSGRTLGLGAALQAAWSLGRESGAGESLEALCQRCVALDESTRTQPQARQQAAYEQAYRRYLEHLPPR
ncbi:xylulose kinase [Pseudomonas aeruginosa VRFPA02]|nr:xylulose kinase [Pseudomonas aeruginosa VRFPA02]